MANNDSTPIGVDLGRGIDVASEECDVFDAQAWNDGSSFEMIGYSGVKIFLNLRNKMEDISPEQDESILKRIKRLGMGGVLPKNALVTVHLRTYLDHSLVPFASTYWQNKPYTFRLDSDKVILGLNISVKSMELNEQSEFLITPAYAYGIFGVLNQIPSNSTILLHVDVIACVDNYAIIEFNNMTPEEQSSATFQDLMKVARAQHLTGNYLEKAQMCDRALRVYVRATRLLDAKMSTNDTEEAESQNVLLKLYINISRLSFLFKKYRKCCEYGVEAKKIDPGNVKALYWVGCACTQLCDWERAKKDLVKARQVDPRNKQVIQALEMLNKKKKEEDEKEKKLYRRMFASI